MVRGGETEESTERGVLPHRRCRARHTAVVAAVCAVAVVAAGCVPNGTPPPAIDPGASEELTWLTAVRGTDAGVYDEYGRQVILRGANFNHLGDYFQTHPDLPTVTTLDEADWDDAAAQGMNVIRLVTSWSAWEPQRDQFDLDYLARVRAAVEDANEHGIYVVIDLHQDAWSKFVYTPAAEVCPQGTRHQIGWDGAPEWATFTDGAATCTPGGRESSPAVRRAWGNFYANHDGIRDEMVELWGWLATQFAHDPGVAGFDLLNEPGYSSNADAAIRGLTRFYQDAIRAIRAAERAADGQGHIVFFESPVFAAFVPVGFSDDPNLVYSPHNYAESIGPSVPGLLDLNAQLQLTVARSYGTTTWNGEYGAFGGDRRAWMERFNRLDDANPGAGGTWWQWEQQCGDPHDVGGAYPPSAEWVAQQAATCGESARMDTPCTARSYPRAVPGRLESLEAALCGGDMIVTGRTATPSTAELWYQGELPSPPTVSGAGIGASSVEARRGGYRVTVEVSGSYRIELTAG
jgi:endoglycosylceramidase